MAKEYDVKTYDNWTDGGKDGAHLLTMPNIPHPLHLVNPRTIVGDSQWTRMRKYCYYDAGYKCQACGRACEKGQCHAHEVYDIDYMTGESRFVRTVCLCPLCHVAGIHSGRALTSFKKGDPLMPKSRLLAGAENLFKIIHEWNIAHPDEDPLRAYDTFLSYAETPAIAKEMSELIEKYDMKFYSSNKGKGTAKWKDWHLIFGNKRYDTPYEDVEDWQRVMDKKNAKYKKVIEEEHILPIYSEIDAIIAESKQTKSNP